MDDIVNRIKFENVTKESIILNIQDYLIEVLLFSEKVSLPGFGSFIIKKKSADISGSTVTPPKSELEFDSTDTMDDDLFSRKISEAEDISQDEAQQKVFEYIDSIRFSLDKGESFKIIGLCTLFRDDNNKVSLEKDPALMLDYENFGLESFELDNFEDEPIEELEKSIAPENKKASSAQEAKKEIINPTAPVNKKSNRSTVWFIVGAVVVIAAAFIIVPLKTSIFDSGLGFDSFFDNEELVIDDDFSDAEEGEFSFDALVDELENDIDSATSMENAMNPTVTVPVIVKAEFHIIAGSFKDFKNAELLQKQLTFEGYPALIIEPGNSVYRVSAISFSNKNTALTALITFREEMNMSGAWMMNLE